ncbi:MAG: hypothetical protein IJB62_06990 [Alistipes sp.]|nr:hypothetical protein [Alistipes sp.]
MELKTLQKELQRLNELVGAWQQDEEITTIERDLVLARLRDLYEAIRFGVEPRVEPAAVAPIPVPAVELETEQEQAPVEEEPLALEADDFFSLDAIVPFGEEPMEESMEEPAGEPMEEPVSETVAPAVEAEVEAQAEPMPEPEVVAEPEPEPEVVAEPEPEPEPEFVAEPQPELESTPEPERNTFQTLFGAEPAEDRHRRKQRVIMSLYDVSEPMPQHEAKSEEPAPVVEVRVEQPIAQPEEAVVQLVPPMSELIESDEESEVIEISDEELENAPESVVEHNAEPNREVQQGPSPTAAVEAEDSEEVAEEPAFVPAVEENPAVLGEVMTPAPTLADQLAARQTVNDLRPKVTDLRRAVGLNDKFLLIRDLFGGNGSLYEITIRKLNEFDNFDDCMIYIAEHFAWNPNSDGAKLMIDLLERKFEQ